MKKNLTFEQREEIARAALLELQELYPYIFKYNISFTIDKFARYDAYYMVLNDETQSIKKRVWIELKIRDTSYLDYILEDKKYQDILNEMNNMGFSNDDVDILYLNYTPDGTYIWKINNIDKKYQVEDKLMNKCTTISRNNKSNKKVYMLETKDAKKLNYIIDVDRIFKKITYKIEKDLKESRGLDAFFDKFNV